MIAVSRSAPEWGSTPTYAQARPNRQPQNRGWHPFLRGGVVSIIERVLRLLLMGRSPATLPGEPGRDWVGRQAAGLAALPSVDGVSLCPLGSASPRWSSEFEWLLELRLRDGTPVGDVVEHRLWVELLADLRLLGMRPQVTVADASRAVELEAG
jgi:hypothetical protein